MQKNGKFKVNETDKNITHNEIANIYAKQLMRAVQANSAQQPPPQQKMEPFNFNVDFSPLPKNEISEISTLTKTLQNTVTANNFNELDSKLNSIENEYEKLERRGQYDQIKRNINIVDNMSEGTKNSDIKNLIGSHTKKMKGKYFYINEESRIYKIIERMKKITEIAKTDFNAEEIKRQFDELAIDIQYYLKSEKNYTDLREAFSLFVDELKTKYENNTQKKFIIESIEKLLDKFKFIYSSRGQDFLKLEQAIKEIKGTSVYNPSIAPDYSAIGDYDYLEEENEDEPADEPAEDETVANDTAEDQTAADYEPVFVMATNKEESFSRDTIKDLVTKYKQRMVNELNFNDPEFAKLRYETVKNINVFKKFLKSDGILTDFYFSDDVNFNTNLVRRLGRALRGGVKRNEEIVDFILQTKIYLIPNVTKDQWKNREKNKLDSFIKGIYCNNDEIVKNTMDYYEKRLGVKVKFEE